MKTMITTIDELIDAFGGPTALAALLRIKQPAVSKWSMNNEIPRGWHHPLSRMAEARGLTVHDSVWGLDGFDPISGFQASSIVDVARA